MKTIGHRGAGFLEPENTLRGFGRAVTLGLDCVEFDVRRCKSGEIVVMHDESVERTTNGKGFVAGMELDELKQLNAGSGEKIPTLQEAIDFCKGKVKMCVELKEAGIEGEVVKALIENGVTGDVLLKSFYHELARKAKRIAELQGVRMRTGVLFVGNPVNAVEMARAANADVVSANQQFVDGRLASQVRSSGLTLAVWNCDTREEVEKMLDIGVDMIATNRPDLLLEILKK